jgi:iron complex outermembrane receptor protein
LQTQKRYKQILRIKKGHPGSIFQSVRVFFIHIVQAVFGFTKEFMAMRSIGIWIWPLITISIALTMVPLVVSAAEHTKHSSHGHGTTTTQMETITVTASKIDIYVKNHPQQVTVMTRDQIKQGSYTDLNQVLNAMPGVEVKKSSGIGSRISIRGSGGSGKILILINGRPANSTQYGGVDLDSLPLDMVTRVDVFKPPVPIWLGPGGTAGAINIVLAKHSPKDPEKQKNSRIEGLVGSYGKAGLSASHLMRMEEHQLRLTASANHKDGHRSNSDRDSGSISAQWDLPAGETTSIDINTRYYYSEHGSAGPTYNLTPDARQKYQKGALDFRVQGLLGETVNYDLKTYLDVTHLKDESQTGSVSTLDAWTYGVKNETNWSDENDKWAVRLAAQLAQDNIEHTLSGDHHRELASLGLQGDKNVDSATATLGARCDYTSDFDFQPAVNGGVSISLGERSQVKINAGYGVNVPTFGHLYQSSHGSIDQVRGNPNLREESVWTVSAGMSHRFSKKRTVEITFFHEDIDHKIVYQEGADLIKRPVNIDGAYRQGVETVVNWQLASTAGVDLSYVWQQSRNREDDKELTYTPDHKFKVTLNWAWPTKTRAEATLTSVSRQFSDLENSSEKAVGGYTTVDLKITHPIYFTKCKTELFVHLENLLDEDYESHYGYPDDGFCAMAGVNIEF